MGALYAKCAHLPYHDVGAWFRGDSIGSAADALGFSMAPYTEAPTVSRDAFASDGHGKTGLDGYRQHRVGVDKDMFATELEVLGASISDDKPGATISTSPTARPDARREREPLAH